MSRVTSRSEQNPRGMLHGAMDEWTEPDALDRVSHSDPRTLLLWYEACRSVRLRRPAHHSTVSSARRSSAPAVISTLPFLHSGQRS
jgi:hypothetical protein